MFNEYNVQGEKFSYKIQHKSIKYTNPTVSKYLQIYLYQIDI